MSRPSDSSVQVRQEVSRSSPSAMNEQLNPTEFAAGVTEDSNNNVPSEDAGQLNEASAENARSGQTSPTVREIHKNSWLKRMPSADRWSGRFPKAQKPEKFWVVFCVHDDKEAFLEFYENRRSAYSHMPLSQTSLSECLHISPTIVAQENDHEFVITLESQVIRLAASTNEQMLEWMDTLRNKLRELGVLEPKDNLYSKEPITTYRPLSISSASESLSSFGSQSREDFSRLSMRDPNSPLPPVPNVHTASTADVRETSSSNSTIVYVRNPPILRSSSNSSNSAVPSPPGNESTHILDERPSRATPENMFSFDATTENTEHNTLRILRSDSVVSSDSATSESSIPDVHRMSTVSEESSLYEPLFCQGVMALNQSLSSISIRNPNYENPPMPHRHVMGSSPSPALPPRPDQRRLSSSSFISDHFTSRTRALTNGISASEPSLNAPSQVGSVNSLHGHSEVSSQQVVGSLPADSILSHQEVRNVLERGRHLPSDEGPPPYNGIGIQQRNSQPNSTFGNYVDENGKPLSLREVQVLKLHAEILHKSGVRLILRKRDCVNAIALVECFGYVWVSGWKQKEHPLLHNTFHVGDRIISIGGHGISNVQDAHKAIKHQSSLVEFVVKRTPHGKILAVKREHEGQDLGIVREGGTAEIKEVKENGLAFKYGLPFKAPTLDGSSQCNWMLTEINHRPLNLFFKDNEVKDRLNAVGLDISLLVQPIDLVKSLKKQLKALRSYKDYIVQ